MWGRRWRWWRLLLPALALSAVCGCATYSSRTADLRPQLSAGNFDAALKTISDGTGKRDRLLSLLEQGLVLHYADRYLESNDALARAEQLAEDLYTKSVSQGALSLVTSDEAIDYRARPFELAMVPYYKALNYLYLGQPQEAVVEARRAELLQAQAVEATLANVRQEDRQDLARIRTDPFLLYFSGMLHEQVGEVNDAFISYRNAAAAYQDLHELLDVDPPPWLGADLARVARRLAFSAELEQARQDYPAVFPADGGSARAAPDTARQTGRVVVLIETGYVPQKTQVRFDFPVFGGEAYDDPDYWSWEIYAGMGNFQALTAGRKVEYWVSVAAPQLQDEVQDAVAGCRLIAGGATVGAVAAANLARQARITFDAEKPTIFFKTILRGLTKYLATRQTRKSAGKVFGWLANAFGAATEKADTRCWSTLPDRVLLGRMDLPPGRHDLHVALLDASGRRIGTQVIRQVEVKPGGWTFVSRRVF